MSYIDTYLMKGRVFSLQSYVAFLSEGERMSVCREREAKQAENNKHRNIETCLKICLTNEIYIYIYFTHTQLIYGYIIYLEK